MDRFDSFPLAFGEESTQHEGVFRPIKSDMKVSVKIVAIGVFYLDDTAVDLTLTHTFATLSKSPANPGSFRYYRGGCMVENVRQIVDIELHLLENGSVHGTAKLYDRHGQPMKVKSIHVVLNFMITKED